MLKKLIKNQDGSVFIITLIVLVVLSILGTAVINVALSNNKMSIHDNEYQSVYYVAEAGVRYVGNSIATNIEDIYLNSDSKNEYFNNIDAFIYDALYGYNSGANSDDFIDVRGSQPDITISLED